MQEQATITEQDVLKYLSHLFQYEVLSSNRFLLRYFDPETLTLTVHKLGQENTVRKNFFNHLDLTLLRRVLLSYNNIQWYYDVNFDVVKPIFPREHRSIEVRLEAQYKHIFDAKLKELQQTWKIEQHQNENEAVGNHLKIFFSLDTERNAKLVFKQLFDNQTEFAIHYVKNFDYDYDGRFRQKVKFEQELRNQQNQWYYNQQQMYSYGQMQMMPPPMVNVAQLPLMPYEIPSDMYMMQPLRMNPQHIPQRAQNQFETPMAYMGPQFPTDQIPDHFVQQIKDHDKKQYPSSDILEQDSRHVNHPMHNQITLVNEDESQKVKLSHEQNRSEEIKEQDYSQKPYYKNKNKNYKPNYRQNQSYGQEQNDQQDRNQDQKNYHKYRKDYQYNKPKPYNRDNNNEQPPQQDNNGQEQTRQSQNPEFRQPYKKPYKQNYVGEDGDYHYRKNFDRQDHTDKRDTNNDGKELENKRDYNNKREHFEKRESNDRKEFNEKSEKPLIERGEFNPERREQRRDYQNYERREHQPREQREHQPREHQPREHYQQREHQPYHKDYVRGRGSGRARGDRDRDFRRSDRDEPVEQDTKVFDRPLIEKRPPTEHRTRGEEHFRGGDRQDRPRREENRQEPIKGDDDQFRHNQNQNDDRQQQQPFRRGGYKRPHYNNNREQGQRTQYFQKEG